jgi:hypothetical protein
MHFNGRSDAFATEAVRFLIQRKDASQERVAARNGEIQDQIFSSQRRLVPFAFFCQRNPKKSFKKGLDFFLPA